MANDKLKHKKATAGKAGRFQSKRSPKSAKESAEPADVILSSVPRKKGKQHSVRLTSHKARSRWFQARASWPVREAPVNRLLHERLRVEKPLAVPQSVNSIWECVGPTNIGGRITSLACHPKHPERLWPARPEAASGIAKMVARTGRRAGMIRTF